MYHFVEGWGSTIRFTGFFHAERISFIERRKCQKGYQQACKLKLRLRELIFLFLLRTDQPGSPQMQAAYAEADHKQDKSSFNLHLCLQAWISVTQNIAMPFPQSGSGLSALPFSTAIQGDHSGSSQPPANMKTKLVFQCKGLYRNATFVLMSTGGWELPECSKRKRTPLSPSAPPQIAPLFCSFHA